MITDFLKKIQVSLEPDYQTKISTKNKLEYFCFLCVSLIAVIKKSCSQPAVYYFC